MNLRLRRHDTAPPYDRQGYVVVRNLLPPDLVDAARAEAVAICRGQCGPVDGATHASEV